MILISEAISLADVNFTINVIDAIMGKLEQHRMVALSEHLDMTLYINRQILELAA